MAQRESSEARLTLGTVDHDWRFREISPDAAEWLGWSPEEYRGTPLQSVVHPDDAPLLLLALGRSSVERRGVATGLRVRSSDGSWTPVRCEVSPLCRHNPPRFAVAMWSRPVARRGVLRAARGAPGGPPLAHRPRGRGGRHRRRSGDH